MTQAESILRAKHDLLPTEDSDFTISSQSQILDTLSSVTTTLTVFLGAIAGISLLVGGIGIMNIMLVSVTERTREIGLRKAVGARKDHILFQFLVETITLSVLGGVIGILLGAAIAAVFTALGLITAVVSRLLDFDVLFLRGGHRPVLRTVSRLPGCQPAPHGSAAVRINLLIARSKKCLYLKNHYHPVLEI